jgi:hypothetical protein
LRILRLLLRLLKNLEQKWRCHPWISLDMEYAQSSFITGLNLGSGNCDLAERLSHNKSVALTSGSSPYCGQSVVQRMGLTSDNTINLSLTLPTDYHRSLTGRRSYSQPVELHGKPPQTTRRLGKSYNPEAT